MKNRKYFNGCILLAAVLLSACEGSKSSSSSSSPSPSTTSSVPSAVSVSLSDSTPTAGQSLTLRATVRCSTSSACRSTSIVFRRSTNLIFSNSDTLVRTVTIPALAAGASHTATTTTTAVAGQYYGACIGTDCEHSSIQVPPTTSSTPSVSSFSLSDTTPTAGQSLTLRATVRCSTSSSCRSTSISFRRSTNLVFSSSDTLLRTVTIPTLAAGASHTATTTTTAVAGQYYGACIGTDCEHSSIQVPSTTSSVPSVSSFSLSDTTPTAGQSLTLRATVRCSTSSDCRSTIISFHRDGALSIISSDTLVGTGTIRALAAGASYTATTTTTAVAGQYYGACIGTDCEHSIIRVPPSTTSSIPSVSSFSLSDTTPTAGQSLTLRATVRCSTSSDCRSTSISFRRSTNLIFSSSDNLVRTVTVPALAAGASYTATTTTTAVAGQYYGACIGTDCEHSSAQVTSPPIVPPAGPTWTLIGLTKIPSGLALLAGVTSSLTASIRCNLSRCPSVTVSFHRYTIANPHTVQDYMLGSGTLRSLGFYETGGVSISYTEPFVVANTAYDYGICIQGSCTR